MLTIIGPSDSMAAVGRREISLKNSFAICIGYDGEVNGSFDVGASPRLEAILQRRVHIHARVIQISAACTLLVASKSIVTACSLLCRTDKSIRFPACGVERPDLEL